jgi:predicted nucleotidyltransferase
MSAAQPHYAELQHAVLDRWVASLAQLPAVRVIWLEGSLVDGRANPWSDIDLRLGIDDEAYEAQWEKDRSDLLEGLGEHLLLWDRGFVRALTTDGIIVELGALKTSELEGRELYEWKVLFDRRPEEPPAFKKLPERSTAETWPGPPVTVEDVHNRTLFILHSLAIAAQDFWRGETCAQAFTLDYLRSELFQILYQRLGIRFAKRNKELSRIFPAEFIEDLKSTYTQPGQSALDPAAIAAAQVRTLSALGKHLQALSDQVGGGFEAEWYPRLLARLTRDLSRLVRHEAGHVP